MKHYPLQYPCRVIRVDPATLKATHSVDCFGDCQMNDGRILIRLSKSLKEYEVAHTLCHEWAHALLFQLPQALFNGDHDDIFAIVHTRILNAMLQQT